MQIHSDAYKIDWKYMQIHSEIIHITNQLIN